MTIDKYELIRKLGYKAHVLDNAAWGIQQLQNHISDMDSDVTPETAVELDAQINIIDNSNSVSEIETATYNAEVPIWNGDENGDHMIDKQDLLWRTRSKVNLLDAYSEWIKKLQAQIHGLEDYDEVLLGLLKEHVDAIEETDDLAVLQTAIQNADRVLGN